MAEDVVIVSKAAAIGTGSSRGGISVKQ
jgi:hypothetical protein